MRGRKSAGMRSRTQLSVLAVEGDDHDADPGRTHGRASVSAAKPAAAPPRRVVEEALGGRVRIHRGRVLPRRPLVEADLATGAPVQRATPGDWAGLNGLPATRTRLAVRPYTAGRPRRRAPWMCSLRSRLARSSLAATLTRRTASISGSSPTVANGLSRPAQSTAAVHVADATEHAAWSSSTAARVARVVVGEQQLDAATEVGVGATEVRPTPPRPGWRLASGMRNVSTSGALKHTACHPATSTSTHLVVRAHPQVAAGAGATNRSSAGACAAPRRRPTRSRHACRGSRPTRSCARPRRHTDQLGGLETDHLAVDERRAQRRRRTMDGVGICHRASTLGTVRWASGCLRQLTHVRQGETDEAVVAASHLRARRRSPPRPD